MQKPRTPLVFFIIGDEINRLSICYTRTYLMAEHFSQFGWQCFFIAHKQLKNSFPFYTLFKFFWVDTHSEISEILRCNLADYIIIDHDVLDKSFEEEIKYFSKHSMKVVVVEDSKNRLHLCDILISCDIKYDPNAFQLMVPSNTKILTGEKYNFFTRVLRNEDIPISKKIPECFRIIMNIVNDVNEPHSITLEIAEKNDAKIVFSW